MKQPEIMACRLDELMRYKRRIEHKQEILRKEAAEVDNDIVKLIASVDHDNDLLRAVLKPYLEGAK